MVNICTTLPRRCLLCRQPAIGDGLCPACRSDLVPQPDGLCRCGLIASGKDGGLCGRCLAHPPPFARLYSQLRYQYPLDHLLGNWKYHRQLSAERALLGLLPEQPPGGGDALVPVPLHWRRQWWRGFNQARRLADALAGRWQLPVCEALARNRATTSQQHLGGAQRRRNLAAAFRCRAPVKGLHLILVDDVATTASTVAEASRCLLAHGARQVDVWTLARTPMPS